MRDKGKDDSEKFLSWEDVEELKRDGENVVVVIENKVYSIKDGDFLHPGGTELLRKYSGTDATDVFFGNHPKSHRHSNAAKSLLETFCMGQLSTPPSLPFGRRDPSVATTNKPKFQIDESKPLLWQVGFLDVDDYMGWVHNPVPGHPRFFKSDWAEAITKTPWWVVPVVWLPLTFQQISKAESMILNPLPSLILLVSLGIFLWQALEYTLHRFVFHVKPKSRIAISLHFLIHGCHHKYPMDIERLVFPPIPASGIVAAVNFLVKSMCTAVVGCPAGYGEAIFGGIMLGYVAYDCMHYWMHSGLLGGNLRSNHMRHHYTDATKSYGISTRLFDYALNTM